MASDNQETTVGGVAGKTAKGALGGAALMVLGAAALIIGGIAAVASLTFTGAAVGLVAIMAGSAIGTNALIAAGAVGGGYALAKGVSRMRGESQAVAQEEERNKVFAATLQAAQVDAYNQGVNAGQGQVIAKLQEIQQSAYARAAKSNYGDDEDKSNFAARVKAGGIKPEAIRQQQAEAAHAPKQVG